MVVGVNVVEWSSEVVARWHGELNQNHLQVATFVMVARFEEIADPIRRRRRMVVVG